MDSYYNSFGSRPYSEASASEEARKFIAALPPDFVESQKRAILSAISGDSSELDKIRAARKVSAEDLSSVDVADVLIGGGRLRVRIYTPKTGFSESRRLLFYVHGGGWTINCPENCARFCRDFCVQNDCVVAAVDYRLAPENPYPAPDDDVFEAYGWAFENAKLLGADTDRFFVCGDSAGGHLALSLALRLRGAANAPEGVIAFYLVVDLLDFSDESYARFGEGYCLNGGLMKLFAKAYAPDKKSAEAATLLGKDAAGLPRTLILASECDVLRGQAERYYEQLKNSGVSARLVLVRGATHIYITQKGMDGAYATALKEASDFLEA